MSKPTYNALVGKVNRLEKEKDLLIELVCDGYKSPMSKTGYACGWEITKEELIAGINKLLENERKK